MVDGPSLVGPIPDAPDQQIQLLEMAPDNLRAARDPRVSWARSSHPAAEERPMGYDRQAQDVGQTPTTS